eukprot:s317_g34.t2
MNSASLKKEEPRRADSNATPSSGPVSLTPETPSAGTAGTGATASGTAPFTGELALRPVGGGPRYETAAAAAAAAHPLLRALYELHQVSDILRQCTSFWSHIEGTVKELARSKDHAQSLLRYASKSHRLKERFDQRLMEYSAFWASLLLLCDQYCAEVQPALQQMSQFLRHAEVAADFSDVLTVWRSNETTRTALPRPAATPESPKEVLKVLRLQGEALQRQLETQHAERENLRFQVRLLERDLRERKVDYLEEEVLSLEAENRNQQAVQQEATRLLARRKKLQEAEVESAALETGTLAGANVQRKASISMAENAEVTLKWARLNMADNLDDLDDFDDEPRDLTWSWRYVSLCLLIPLLNGFINGYCWAGLSLHYRQMGWSIARVGTASTFGFIGRILCQKIQVRYGCLFEGLGEGLAGFWVMIPLGLVHLILTILGVIYYDQEWAVICEVAALQSLDGAITNEGLAFDAFGLTEDLARQAAATVLAMFTISGALSVPIGGALYDNVGGWQAMSMAHLVCQGILFLLFTAEPGVRQSLRGFFSKEDLSPSGADGADGADGDERIMVAVLPSDAKDPGEMGETETKELHVESVENLPGVLSDEPKQLGQLLSTEPADGHAPRKTARASMQSRVASAQGRESRHSDNSDTLGPGPSARGKSVRGRSVRGRSVRGRSVRGRSVHGRSVRKTRLTNITLGTRQSLATMQTNETGQTGGTLRTVRTARSNGTKGTGTTMLSRLTSLTNLKDSENFQFHPAAIASLQPCVARKTGTFMEDPELEEEKGKSIPKDTIIPALMISLCCFNNTVCYIIELSTFVLFFKEYHGWNSATGIGVAQSSGDLTAAFLMKLLPGGSNHDESSAVGCCRRIFMEPYNLSWLVLLWVLCNLGMASPWLAAAVTAQVLMGSLFVYNAKFTTDLNLFYSLGDNGIFLTMQVWSKTAHAISACLSSFCAPVIYSEVSPVAPFFLATSVSTLTFVAFTTFFACRVGLEDLETAEEQRAQRLGATRELRWAATGVGKFMENS